MAKQTINKIPAEAGTPTTADVQTALGISAGGSATKVLNEQGDFIAMGGGGSTPEEDQWYDIGDLVAEELIFLVASGGIDGYNITENQLFGITCTVENAGNYTVELYGADETLIKTITTVSAKNIVVPLIRSEGVPNTYGYSTFKVRVYSADNNNKITLFTLNYSLINPSLLLSAKIGCTALTTLSQKFYNCISLRYVEYTSTMNAVSDCYRVHGANKSLKSAILPTSMTAQTSFLQAFDGCWSLLELVYPAAVGICSSLEKANYQNYNIKKITLPTAMTSMYTLTNFIDQCFNLEEITVCTEWADDVIPTASILNCYMLESFNQSDLKAGKLSVSNTTGIGVLTYCNFDYANSLFAGTSPQIDFTYNSLDATEIDRILTALPTLVGKTITVKGNPGAATCDPTIATAKGWTVTTA